MGVAPDGMRKLDPDGVRLAPSEIRYLGNKKEIFHENLSARAPSGRRVAPDDYEDLHRTTWKTLPVRDTFRGEQGQDPRKLIH